VAGTPAVVPPKPEHFNQKISKADSPDEIRLSLHQRQLIFRSVKNTFLHLPNPSD
jgi:hypothetical protein